jgi:hypothetical protein
VGPTITAKGGKAKNSKGEYYFMNFRNITADPYGKLNLAPPPIITNAAITAPPLMPKGAWGSGPPNRASHLGGFSPGQRSGCERSFRFPPLARDQLTRPCRFSGNAQFARNAKARASPSGSGSGSFHALPLGVVCTILGTLIAAA